MIKKPNESPLEIRGGVIVRNTVLNLAGLALPVIVGVVTIPLTIRLMGTEHAGDLGQTDRVAAFDFRPAFCYYFLSQMLLKGQ